MACLVQNTSVDSGKSGSWSPLYGGTRLDQDTIQYIHKFYCKDCRMEAERAKAAAEGGMVGEEAVEIKQEPSSPHNSFEDMSLQRSMDKNKESLKRKLMMRRSLIELVDQGIYPPPKTPPAFAEQRKLLERAKTGDLLRHKIQHRPDRQLLVQQHILEDTKIDPSLHERQRQLKRARLADNLNDKLLHRPGVLELVEGNILPDENLLEAIKDGSLTFNKSVDQGDEDSQSLYTVMEDGNKSCDESPSSDQNEDSNMSDISSPPIPPPPLPFHDLSLVFSKPSQPQVQQFTFHNKIPGPSANLSLVASTVQKNTPVSAFSGTGNSLSPKSVTSVSSNSNNGNNKSRQKKLKPKTQPKAKVIKFHEYKGPPNVVKTQQIIQQNNTQETPYHVLLQQQQLFLQWQLEFQQKNMNNINVPILVPAQNVVTPECQPGPQFVSSSPASSATNVAVTSVASLTTAPITITTQNGPQTVISVAASQPAAPTPATVIKASKFQHHIKLESSLQNQMTTSVKPELMLVAQPQPQLPPSGIQNPLPISQPGPRCTSSNKSQNKKTSNTSSTPSKPITSLEDMKVADLRAELKKRNMPVSGPKPQLIERLKPYTDVIIQASQNYALSYSTHSVTSPASVQTSQDSVMSPTSTVYSPPGSVAPNEDIIGSNAVSPLAPIHSITSVVSMPSVMSPEDPKSISPPTTPPEFHNILTPMSPDMMDIPSPSNATMGQQTKSQQLNASQNSIAMNISRPPSVMADAPMEVDSSELFLNVSQANQVLTTPTTIKFLQSPHAQTQPLQLQQQQQRPLVQVVQPQPQQQQVQISQCQLSQEELLKQQQQKIEELQRQLEESQLRLKLQLLQHQHMQQQQQNLQQLQQQQQQIQQIQQQQAQLQQQQQLAAQQQQAVLSKPVQLKQPKSPPQVIINVTNSKTVSPNHQQMSPPAPPPPPPPPPLPSQLSSAKSIHIPAQLLQAVQTTHGLPAVIVTSTKSDPDKKKPNLSKIFKSQSINQNLKLGGRMVSVASAPAELHQFILTTTSTAISSSGQAPINGIVTPARMSLPGSPVDDSKQPLGKSQSNPFFIPLKEPPKYDEAIKRRQQHQQQATTSTVQESTKTQPAAHTMDDVLEILIRSGELPPSAAQEPPPTPKTTIQTDTVSTITIAQAGTMPVENCMSSAGTLQLVTAFSTAAINDSNAGQNITSIQEQVSSTPQTFKQEPLSPPSFTEPASSPPPVETNTDFLDINDMLGQDLNSMDWTSDPAFSGLDITDTSCMTTDFDFKQHFINERSLLELPTSHLSSSMKSFYGSEPDLAALGLSDTGENSNMQIDVPDWFDVIMPSTGMTPLSGNAPVSFPSDPILTPRTHLEVLDLFSFDDTDLSTPSELTYGANWDKITEGTASSTS